MSILKHTATHTQGRDTMTSLALMPRAGARWVGVDDQRAIVTLDAAGTDVEVEAAVGGGGNILWLGLQRWKDSAKPPDYACFGGSVDSTFTATNGVQIAGTGTVGWDWQTPTRTEGVFFRYRIVSARFGDTSPRTNPGTPSGAGQRVERRAE